VAATIMDQARTEPPTADLWAEAGLM
jgi:hypothetical protein